MGLEYLWIYFGDGQNKTCLDFLRIFHQHERALQESALVCGAVNFDIQGSIKPKYSRTWRGWIMELLEAHMGLSGENLRWETSFPLIVSWQEWCLLLFDHLLTMWSCSLSWHDESKAQEMQVFLDQWSQTRFRKYLFLNRIRKVEFCSSTFAHFFVSYPSHHAFLWAHCYDWYQDIRNSLLSAKKGPFFYYYSSCWSLVLQRVKELSLTDGSGWGGTQQQTVAGIKGSPRTEIGKSYTGYY